jgi:ATP-dependent RNA helicase DHX29
MTKKKKKPVANPARGFATVSVPSKKPIIEDDDSEQQGDAEHEATPQNQGEDNSKETKEEKELHQLTAEELESRLELNDLQSFIEAQGSKTARDSQRQISKLQTDCRVVRPQSFSINTFRWLPEELLDEIIAFAREEQSNITAAPLPKDMTEDDWTTRFWTLMRTLLGIGIPKEKVLELLKQVQLKDPSSDNSTYIWGLQESLDRLAQESNLLELPSYDVQRSKVTPESYENSDASRPASGAVTPLRIGKMINSLDSHSISKNASASGKATSSLRPHDIVKNGSVLKPPEIIQLDSEEFYVSDMDSDVDVDEMMSIYMASKTKLFSIHPDLAGTDAPTKKPRKGGRQPTVLSNSPSIRKVQDKIRRIEGDILFDKEQAMDKWSAERLNLLREAGSTKRPTSRGGSSGEEIKKPNDIPSDEDSDHGPLGGMFALPTDKDDAPTVDASGISIILRDFGKITGISPRRLLEDACRARLV